MENAAPLVGLETRNFFHRANHLCHGGWRIWQELTMFYWNVIELLAIFDHLFSI